MGPDAKIGSYLDELPQNDHQQASRKADPMIPPQGIQMPSFNGRISLNHYENSTATKDLINNAFHSQHIGI